MKISIHIGCVEEFEDAGDQIGKQKLKFHEPRTRENIVFLPVEFLQEILLLKVLQEAMSRCFCPTVQNRSKKKKQRKSSWKQSLKFNNNFWKMKKMICLITCFD